VIIPTYNNERTLRSVISGVYEYTGNIIIVNDGSTDGTKEIIGSFPDILVLHFSKNHGKGYALRNAIKYACEQGYDYGITLDSDGQHFPSDLPLFLLKIKQNPDTIMIGSRNMEQENVPGKSSFGNKFSNFWFLIETGLKLPDTQSGYRLYPLYLLNNMHFFGRKYEFEVEVLVRAAWRRIKILPVPIHVYYPPEKERISHFRPFADFARIFLLNTILVIIAFLFIKPFGFIRSINKKNITEIFQNKILHSTEKNSTIIASVMVGFFFSVAPFWGWQIWIALAFALLFKLNKFIVAISTTISVAPLIPLIIYLSYVLGGVLYKQNSVLLAYSNRITLQTIEVNIVQYLIGSFFLGFILSIVGGILTYILLRIFRK